MAPTNLSEARGFIIGYLARAGVSYDTSDLGYERAITVADTDFVLSPLSEWHL